MDSVSAASGNRLMQDFSPTRHFCGRGNLAPYQEADGVMEPMLFAENYIHRNAPSPEP